jgi:ankyrin repeat protein
MKAAEQLVSFGGAVETAAYDGITPLHLAAGSTDGSTCTELLIVSAAPVNAQARDGRTPMHIAAEYGRFERIQTLIDHGQYNI